MTTTPKTQKDKPYSTAPKLMPRPTAASAARAARNATNRNLLLPQTQRQSPTRTANTPSSLKAKSSVIRNTSKCDLKSDVKVQEIAAYFVDTVTVQALVNTPNDNATYSDNSVTVEEINDTALSDHGCNEENPSDNVNEDTDRIAVQLSHSRPVTPAHCSRPHTPKSLQSSQPQTPRVLSRPTTPVNARHSTPVSRPNTPRMARPTTPTLAEKVPTSNSSPVRLNSPNKEDMDIKTMYSLKQKQFHNLKKELDLKQQAVLEIFDSLRSLRERMCEQGMSGSGEGLQQEELVVFNVADWASEEVAQLCRDAAASTVSNGTIDIINNATPFDDGALSEIDAKVTNLPARFAHICLEAFTARQEVIEWTKNIINKHDVDSTEAVEQISLYNAQGYQLCEALREIKTCADSTVNSVLQLSRRACQDRAALVSVGETLVREIARLREDIEARTATVNEIQHVEIDSEASRMLEETRQELEEERAARAVTKKKLSTAEAQLQQTRVRVSKMDRQLREAEASIASLTGTVKSLEDQSRQKEINLEARARKLRESMKTGEVTISQMAQHRDSLQNEIAELKEKLEKHTAQHKHSLQDLSNQLKEAKHALEEQTLINARELEHKQTLQTQLDENQNIVEELRAKISELENCRPNPDLPTEREMDLWAELQATKDTLRITEDEIITCKREKVKFLETMAKISDDKVGMQQKLAAELLSKEDVVGKMQTQMRELHKNIKLNEQKVVQYEQYVRNLQAHNRAVANCQEAPDGISYQDLQQQIMNLKMKLLDAVHRNDELMEQVMQKDQQLEQQDKTSRAQARIIKVREELINVLKNKETEQGRELAALQQNLEHRMNIVAEVNKQIASKAEEIKDLFATLENKQQQIHRLEKIVLALEEQQRRAQAQRTRHEEKIAALEHELAANGSRRERKYLFF